MLTPQQYVQKWLNTPLGERQSYQIHFIELCQMIDHEAPSGQGVDIRGNLFQFEYGVKKELGGQGFADVFYQNHFAMEYKRPGKHKDLGEAYQQLLQYRERLNNPPLLIVCDVDNWQIHTNWPNTEKKVYEFTMADIANRPSIQRMLLDIFTAPDRLHPRRNTDQVTTDAAGVFKLIAENMRDWQADPDRIAHFLTKLVFCLFAEDVSLLPPGPSDEAGIFSEIVGQTRTNPGRFVHYMADLFRAMADGGEIMFREIPYFNGALFEDVRVEELSVEALTALEQASRLNWAAVEPAIFGTLFERSLDPGKRAQLGAHYTSREDILLIVEPVLMQPLRREWEAIQADAAPIREQYDEALLGSNRRSITSYGDALEALREKMLHRLREIKVLDPACGSGNFLYVSLQLLMDMEKAVIYDDLWVGLQQPFPEVHPRQMYGIEVNAIAHALASIVVWIGYIQWRENNGYSRAFKEPILEALHENIRLMDAIMTPPHPQSSQPHPLTPSLLCKEGEQERVSYQHGEGGQIHDSDSPPRYAGERGPGGEVNMPVERGPGGEMDELPRLRPKPELWEKLKPLARQMRHEPTTAENLLWQSLRGKALSGFKFRRQYAIDRFIVDFYCPQAQLVVEVDGEIHQYTQEEDALRQGFLESMGLRVLRFTNDQVLGQLGRVLEAIRENLPHSLTRDEGSQPHPLTPSPLHGEGEQRQSFSPPRYEVERGPGGEVKPTEPDWPTVDVIVGNPPFLGDKRMRGELGDEYVDALRGLYDGRLPGGVDLVCYWHEKARAHIEAGKATRAGLLATNSIRGGANREVLKRIKETGDIFMAWSDREWVLEGAAVRVSMVGFDKGEETQKWLDGTTVVSINADLTGTVDLLQAKILSENIGLSFIGVSQHGPFEIEPIVAKRMINENSKNAKVVRPIINALEITRRTQDRWVIDFEPGTTLEQATLYESPFEYVRQVVLPVREQNNRKQYRDNWWIHGEARPAMRQAISRVPRFIVTPRVAKHRVFVWMTPDRLPSDATVAIAREDDYFFGVLHSRLHEVWSLRMGTWLGVGNDPRYTPTTTFETFPFPWPPGQEDTGHPAYQAISDAAKRLHEEREAWLNPHLTPPPGPLPASQGGGERLRREGEKALARRTLTNLYNALNVFRGVEAIRTVPEAGDFAPRLDELHRALDEAVCDAYGWPYDILGDEEEILRRLLALNLERAGAAG